MLADAKPQGTSRNPYKIADIELQSVKEQELFSEERVFRVDITGTIYLRFPLSLVIRCYAEIDGF